MMTTRKKDSAVGIDAVRGATRVEYANQSLLGAREPIAALNRVRVAELKLEWPEREPLVDIRKTCSRVSVEANVCPYLRRTVSQMLNRAQALLPGGYRLYVLSAFRTRAMQKAGWDAYDARMAALHPQWSLATRRRAVNRFFAPYDQKAPPGHCTGGAVDVKMLDPDGNAVDMVSPTEGWKGAYTWYPHLTPEARRNRMVMVEAMLGAGFSNCRDEYWHYSWGDAAWAVRCGRPTCEYGWAYLPASVSHNVDDLQSAEQPLETLRDPTGRPVAASGVCVPHVETDEIGQSRWRVRLNWAAGLPVALRIRTPYPVPGPIYVADGASGWDIVPETQARNETLLLRLTPRADRVIITDRVPEAGAEHNGAEARRE